jgi:hypothetical protein
MQATPLYPGTGAAESAQAAPTGGTRRPTALELSAAFLLALTVILHVVALFPTYFTHEGSIWSQPDQATMYVFVIAGWLIALGIGLTGPGRAPASAAVAVGVALSELGFRVVDLGTVSQGSAQGSAGFYLMSIAWLVGAAGTMLLVLAVRPRRARPEPPPVAVPVLEPPALMPAQPVDHDPTLSDATVATPANAGPYAAGWDDEVWTLPIAGHEDPTVAQPEANHDDPTVAQDPTATLDATLEGGPVEAGWLTAAPADQPDGRPDQPPADDPADQATTQPGHGSALTGGWAPPQGQPVGDPTTAVAPGEPVLVGVPSRRWRINPFLLLVTVLAFAMTGAFLPSWNHYSVTLTSGTVVSFNRGNAFDNPWQLIVGNVIAALAFALIPVVACTLRNRAVGAAAVAGSLIVMASQFASAVVQASQNNTLAVLGLTPTQAANQGIERVSQGLTAWFTVDVLIAYALFAVVMVWGHLKTVPAPASYESSVGTHPNAPDSRSVATLPWS